MSDIRLVFFRLAEFEAALPASQVESVVRDQGGAQMEIGDRRLHVTDARSVFRLPPRGVPPGDQHQQGTGGRVHRWQGGQHHAGPGEQRHAGPGEQHDPAPGEQRHAGPGEQHDPAPGEQHDPAPGEQRHAGPGEQHDPGTGDHPRAGAVLVVRRGERRFGLRVDALGGMRAVPTADFRPLPAIVERLRPTPALVGVLVAPEPVFVVDAWRLPGALTSLGAVGLPVRDAP